HTHTHTHTHTLAEGASMKDSEDREMARLGDTTDHGGKVIEAAPGLFHMGDAALIPSYPRLWRGAAAWRCWFGTT
ncbi:hypothetical protein SNK19_24250, partial [Ralstonia pseudosolanacearum]